MAYNVFISYETKEGEIYANNLKKALQKVNMDTFLASSEILEEKNSKRKIDSALEKSYFYIIIFTSKILKSEKVKTEFLKALKQNKYIIPCKYSGISFPSSQKLKTIDKNEFEDDYQFKDNYEFANLKLVNLPQIIIQGIFQHFWN